MTQICQDHHRSRLENGDGFGFMELDRRYTVYLKEATHSWKRGTPELSFCVGKKGCLGGGVYPEVDAATDADSRCLTTIIRAGCPRATAHMAEIMDTVLSGIDGWAKQINRDQQRQGKLHVAARISTHYFVS